MTSKEGADDNKKRMLDENEDAHSDIKRGRCLCDADLHLLHAWVETFAHVLLVLLLLKKEEILRLTFY